MTSEEEYVRMQLPKYCFVPQCNNNSVNNSDKSFFSVPPTRKQEWCEVVGRNCPKRKLHICQDHLNLEEDVENYQQWVTTEGCRPRLKARMPLSLLAINSGSDIPSEPTTSAQQATKVDVGISCENIAMTFSKGIQVKTKTSDRSTVCNLKSQKSIRKSATMEVITEEEDILPSTQGSTTITTSATFSETDSTNAGGTEDRRLFMLDLIEQNPKDYLGLPKNYYWLIEFLQTKLRLKKMHILVTLYKIKNNVPFYQIRDLFQISLASLWRCFSNTTSVLSKFFKKFIFAPSILDIKRNLPTSFKTNKECSSVFCIIDCFEIEIEKPSDPIEQSLTWSQYKNANTIKYLLSITPDGFVNYVSAGFGGRTSDVNVVESCGFLNTVPSNCTILADRGFKHLEATLHRQQIKLLRPPSVSQNTKLTKKEAIQSKVIASLRIHVERVIRRIRLFKFLKPHSVINNKLIQHTDEVVIIACGLINMQNSIVNDE